MDEKIKDLHVVIMAGGAGVRFWPASTRRQPKQFLDILGTGRSLLQMTYQRALRLVGRTKVWVVTATPYADLVYSQVPEVPHGNVLLEPQKCNTCPCLAFAAEMIATHHPDEVMLVVPSDHLIVDDARYDAMIRQAYEFAKTRDALLTLGIQPTRPETGYGYIQMGAPTDHGAVRGVENFVEKPTRELAEGYLNSGSYLWNSGIFLWRVSAFQGALKAYQREIYDLFEGIGDMEGGPVFTIRVQEIYERLPSISVDYAIMERAVNVYVLPADFGWSDLGSWSSVGEQTATDAEGNALSGRVLLDDVRRSVVRIPEGNVAILVGLEGYIVSQTEKGLLVCPVAREQEIKDLAEQLKDRYGEEFL